MTTMTPRFRKRPQPLYRLGVEDLALAFAWGCWQEARKGAFLPARAAVDTPLFRLLVDGAFWVSVSAPEPAGWALGRLEALTAGLPEAQASLREDLQAARLTGAPFLQDLDIAGPLGVERYRQLVLPYAEDGRTVSDLLLLLRPLAPGAMPLPEGPFVAPRWGD